MHLIHLSALERVGPARTLRLLAAGRIGVSDASSLFFFPFVQPCFGAREVERARPRASMWRVTRIVSLLRQRPGSHASECMDGWSDGRVAATDRLARLGGLVA